MLDIKPRLIDFISFFFTNKSFMKSAIDGTRNRAPVVLGERVVQSLLPFVLFTAFCVCIVVVLVSETTHLLL